MRTGEVMGGGGAGSAGGTSERLSTERLVEKELVLAERGTAPMLPSEVLGSGEGEEDRGLTVNRPTEWTKVARDCPGDAAVATGWDLGGPEMLGRAPAPRSGVFLGPTFERMLSEDDVLVEPAEIDFFGVPPADFGDDIPPRERMRASNCERESVREWVCVDM